jgi:hypothetical protein
MMGSGVRVPLAAPIPLDFIDFLRFFQISVPFRCPGNPRPNLLGGIYPLSNWICRGGTMIWFIAGADRGQSALLPDCQDDWAGDDNLVHVIAVFVDEFDLAALGFDTGKICSKSSFCGSLTASVEADTSLAAFSRNQIRTHRTPPDDRTLTVWRPADVDLEVRVGHVRPLFLTSDSRSSSEVAIIFTPTHRASASCMLL